MEIERSIQTIQLDHSQLLTLLRKAFPDCQKLGSWEILSGGALNTTYKVQIGDDAVVIRLYARDRSHCKTEKEIHHLIDKRVRTPKLLYTDESHQPWAYSIFEFVPGLHISEVSKKHKTSLCYELGRVLASIHAFKFTKAGLFGERIAIGKSFETDSSPYFEEAFSVLSTGENVRRRLGDRLADKMLSFMQKNKDFFPKVGNDICLTHSDFKPVNLLYSTNEKIFVLDWEFAHAGMGILDFAILLRHRDQFPCDLNALEQGYLASGGILPDEWMRSALITDFVNIVLMLDAPPERPKLFQQLKNAAETTVDYWDSPSVLFVKA